MNKIWRIPPGLGGGSSSAEPTPLTDKRLRAFLLLHRGMTHDMLDIIEKYTRFQSVFGPIKILLVGDGGVGKGDFMRSISGETGEIHQVTLGVETQIVSIYTNRGTVKFDLWMTAGQEKFGGLREQYYRQGKGAIIMFDVTSRITYNNVPNWYRDVTRVCGNNTPIVLVGNKCEVKDRKVKAKRITFPTKKENVQYMDMLNASRRDGNTMTPLLMLAQKLYRDDTLFFVPAPALQPPLAGSPYAQLGSVAAAAAQPFPEDDGDDV